MKNIRVRFAPSPTGQLHIGSLRTALFNYLFAKANNGKFILRIEDTDRDRLVPSALEQIIKSLQWAGIKVDEGPETKNKFGPYIQSQRIKIYQDIAKELVKKGLAYYSHITPSEFEKLKSNAIKNKTTFVYRQEYEPKSKEDNTTKPIRFKVPLGHTTWNDILHKQFITDNKIIDDFIILKADGFPTYNFANVIDDYLMQISHVIRGDEFIASTAKHILLYQALNYPQPEFVHLPVILGKDKTKLSKRHGALSVLSYKEIGYLPEAMINYLALLGWNDTTEQEIYSMDELIKKFKLSDLQKSPAIFDETRLQWLNGEYIRKLKLEELVRLITPYFKKASYDVSDMQYVKKVVKLDQERIKTLAQAADLADFFFVSPKPKIHLICQKDEASKVKNWLNLVIEKLDNTKADHDCLYDELSSLAKHLGITNGQLFFPIRVALTGKTQAPGLFDTILTLGTKESIKRINTAIKIIG